MHMLHLHDSGKERGKLCVIFYVYLYKVSLVSVKMSIHLINI